MSSAILLSPGLLSDIVARTADGESLAIDALGTVSVKGSNMLVINLHDPVYAPAVTTALESKLEG